MRDRIVLDFDAIWHNPLRMIWLLWVIVTGTQALNVILFDPDVTGGVITYLFFVNVLVYPFYEERLGETLDQLWKKILEKYSHE